jgi:hypothetical protein
MTPGRYIYLNTQSHYICSRPDRQPRVSLPASGIIDDVLPFSGGSILASGTRAGLFQSTRTKFGQRIAGFIQILFLGAGWWQ